MNLDDLFDEEPQIAEHPFQLTDITYSDYNGREVYAVSKNGKIQMWKAEVLSEPNPNGWYVIRATYGFTDGAKQTKDTFIKKGTNIGKKNEKTLLEQAYIKLEQMYEDRIKKKSMVWDVKDFVAPKRPMLASPWKKREKHLKNVRGWIIDRKFDGNRAYTYPDSSVQSKSGESVTPLRHIKEDHQSQMDKHPMLSRIELDGEYYIHGVDLCDLTSIISKENDDERPTDVLLQYHVYDCFDPERPNLTALERHNLLTEIFNACDFKYHVHVDKQVIDNDVDLIMEITQNFIDEGFEGSILRDIDGVYMHSKSPTDRNDVMIKVKFMETDEFLIVGIEENENEPGTPKITIDLRNGNTNEVVMSGKKENAKIIYEEREKHIGTSWLETRYQNYTKYGKLSFGVGVRIRLGKVTDDGFDPTH